MSTKMLYATVVQPTAQEIKITLNGWIVEDCALPEVAITAEKSVIHVDCQNLMGINSIGIRTWMLWLKTLNLKSVDHFDFSSVRPSILQQSALVSGFIPPNSIVSSFYIVYWSEELQEEKQYLVSYGRDFDEAKMTLPRQRKETRDGRTVLFEIDNTPKKLGSFYKGVIEII